MIRCIALALSLLLSSISFAQSTEPATYNIRDFGATGDGKHLDSPAIDRAIAAAERFFSSAG
jgi:polygalacturonase